MSKQNSVQWFFDQLILHRYIVVNKTTYGDKVKANYEILLEQAKAMNEEELNVAYGNGYEQGEMAFYKKMQVKGDKYAEGYSEGYKRALDLVKWKIDKDLLVGNNEQQQTR